jgi:hypothetical protein
MKQKDETNTKEEEKEFSFITFIYCTASKNIQSSLLLQYPIIFLKLNIRLQEFRQHIKAYFYIVQTQNFWKEIFKTDDLGIKLLG